MKRFIKYVAFSIVIIILAALISAVGVVAYAEGAKETFGIGAVNLMGVSIGGVELKTIDYVLFASIVILAVISFVMWFVYGRDIRKKSIRSKYPPEGVNSAEIAVLFKSKLSGKDIASLLIYLAEKDYIRLENTGDIQDLNIVKVRDYDGNDESEKIFLDGLFKNGSDKVSFSELYGSFYTVADRVQHTIETRAEGNTRIKNDALAMAIFVMIGIVTLIMYLPPLINNQTPLLYVLIGVFFPGFGFWAFIHMFTTTTVSNVYSSSGKVSNSRIWNLILAIIFGGFFGGMPFVIFVLPALKLSAIYVARFILGIIAVFIMDLCMDRMPRNTAEGAETYAKVVGFKKFLLHAKREELEVELRRNPDYFYKMMAYAYSLDVFKRWVNKFKDINVKAPEWCIGYGTFSVKKLGDFLSAVMYYAVSVLNMRPMNTITYIGKDNNGGGDVGKWR